MLSAPYGGEHGAREPRVMLDERDHGRVIVRVLVVPVIAFDALTERVGINAALTPDPPAQAMLLRPDGSPEGIA